MPMHLLLHIQMLLPQIIIIIIMLSLTSVSASKDDIKEVVDEFMLHCKNVHAMSFTVYMAAGIQTGVAGSQVNRLDHDTL